MDSIVQSLFMDGMETANIGIFAINEEGKILYVNTYVCDYLGYTKEEMLSKFVWEINPSLDVHPFKMKEATEYKKPTEAFHIAKDGTPIPVEISSSLYMIEGHTYRTAMVQDIRIRKKNLETIALFHDLLNNSHDMVFIIRIEDGYIDYVNETAISVTGYTLEEMNEVGIERIRRPLKEEDTFFRHSQELKQVGKLTDHAIVVRKDGTEFPVEANVRYLHRDGIDYDIAIVRDITDRIEAEHRLEHMNQILERAVAKKTAELQKTVAFLNAYKLALDAGNIVSKSDLKGRITYVNENFCTVSGYSSEELIGHPHSIVRHPDTDVSVFRSLWSTIQSKQIWQGIIKNRKKDGGYYWVDLKIVPLCNPEGEIIEYIAVRHEVTELIDHQETLKKVLTTDALTHYGNRYRLMNDIGMVDEPYLALINIDNFREINDFYGHEFGDLLIVEVAGAINAVIEERISKSFYRLNGDEYAILGHDTSKETFVTKIEEIVSTVAQKVFIIKEEEITVQMTASISFETDKSQLFITADMAMTSAKKNQQSLLVYDPSLLLNEECENNVKWTKKIQTAIRQDKIIPYYQPIVDNATGEYSKYEALVRLIDEEDKVISPFFFLEIAKRTKHYGTITQKVLEKSFEYFKECDLSVSVNLTIKDIMEPQTQKIIFDLLEKFGIGERVVFEIVESEGIENFESVIGFIKSAKECGCKIAIDDFGTGYSNFEYLLKLKADFIKIDGSLIKNLHKDHEAKILVSTIVNFSKQLGMQTIAEFVSDEKTFEIVKEMGIDYSQGYYFGEPKPKVVQDL
ncbi:bifunctional diguanylate cyclase/phosphodiesterase [Sulfuricurvum sp.]|uniref:sensor domain-containing protein n=1 Tax=Sulfuricurvum sp. TaxID=2025608 RepID=UPI002630FDCE|nr:GGDEF domain-containing phosphodiesterase [Sulfuricurvum sp.]MDD4882966.1 EAL domain-containing protein [Sulfuricurvum sp.]